MSGPTAKPVLVAGATGYIGARLVPRLLDAGHHVRCLARSPEKLADRPWAGDPRVTIVEGDLSLPDRIPSLLAGCGAAFYLVHSMVSSSRADALHDCEMARTFAGAAATAGLERIVYLGGLGETGPAAGAVLSSRLGVASALASGPVPVTTFRAAMIIGSGSASFEILRYLVERLPVMITPIWVANDIQPIAVRNVLHYLVQSLSVPATIGREFDIGGPDVLAFADLMGVMASERKLRPRPIVVVPIRLTRVSAVWIDVLTPVSRGVARPLVEGLQSPIVCRNDNAVRLMPQALLTVREAIHAALELMEHSAVESVWSAAGPMPGDPDWAGGRVFVDRRSTRVSAPADDVFRAVCRVGGTHGWYAGRWLWAIRGWLDELAGGPGLQRGRRNPDSLSYGEAVDFWRVSVVEPGRRLALRSEMKLPGEALLEFSIEPTTPAIPVPPPGAPAAPPTSTTGSSGSLLVQTATFLPRGLAGLAYWYAVMPFHGLVFSGMLRGIRRSAERAASAPVASAVTR